MKKNEMKKIDKIGNHMNLQQIIHQHQTHKSNHNTT